jgi:uncharacterized protein YceH (UPF0502 family)
LQWFVVGVQWSVGAYLGTTAGKPIIPFTNKSMNDQSSLSEQPNVEGAPAERAAPRWKPLSRIDRRVAGVLIEKAKTTPEQYPMTVNGLVNGCNQKNNRDPQMQLEEADVLESIDRLKGVKAVVEVQGSGRVPKFRHLMYEWLGVDKVELAVMAELLLRGAQTEGELRGRAARMEPIADLAALRTVLEALRAKRLVIDITPPGRGQIISHALYEPEELERLRNRHHAIAEQEDGEPPVARARSLAAPSGAPSQTDGGLAEELRSVRAELAELRRELEALSAIVRRGS